MTNRLLALLFASSLAAGCGGTEQQGVDENEISGDYTPDSALAPGGDAVVANTGGAGLNLRNGPAKTDGVLLTMPEGSQVHLLAGPTNGFYKVTYRGSTGFSYGAYLRGVSSTPPPSGGSQGGVYPTVHWQAASSANYSTSRFGTAIKFVVIHDMEGTYSASISWFENPAAQASAHYSIRSSDGQITQQVRENDTAWHSGNWAVNKESIGIEHEGFLSQPQRWYTETMYQQSAKLTAAICRRYNIPVDRAHIFGHDEVPDPNHPGEFGGVDHHQDPGAGWNWTHYIALVKSYL